MKQGSLLADAAAALRAGEIVGVPTDTVYGIAADPWNEVAVGRLFRLKTRQADKAVPLLAASVGDVATVAVIGGYEAVLSELWPGALTVVLAATGAVPQWIGDRRRTVAVRVPDHPVAVGLLAATGALAVTSANVSGCAAALSHRQAAEMFAAAVSVYLPGTSPGGMASTVVDLSGPEPVLLRAGPVAWPG